MKDNKSTKLQSRHICRYCKKKRYADRMVKVFAHPILTGKNPIYACKPYLGWYRKENKCLEEVQREILMYQETGTISVILNKQT